MGQPAITEHRKDQGAAGRRSILLRCMGWNAPKSRAALKPLADLERLVNRVMAGHAQPRDLVAMRSTLKELPGVVDAIGKPIPALPKD